MALRVYTYAKCDTCRRAKKWLAEQDVAYDEIPIREQPPTAKELAFVLEQMNGELRRLFNTSGGDYRSMGIKDRLKSMSPAEAFELLTANGNLVKRPFVIGPDVGTTGFDADRWAELLG